MNTTCQITSVANTDGPVCSIYLQPVTKREVLALVQQLQNKYSFGDDEIPNALIKFCVEQLTCPLALLLNQSIDEKCFPEQLKTAKIEPI